MVNTMVWDMRVHVSSHSALLRCSPIRADHF